MRRINGDTSPSCHNVNGTRKAAKGYAEQTNASSLALALSSPFEKLQSDGQVQTGAGVGRTANTNAAEAWGR